MDIDNLLNFERRTGIKNADIEDFERKAAEVEAAIKGLMDGTLDPNKIQIEGLETEEQKAKKEAEREEKRRQYLMREEMLKQQRKREERERWWNGAEAFLPSTDPTDTTPTTATNENQLREFKVSRYTADYSKWDSWTPTDEATRLEEEERKALEEKKLNEEFERNNREFCNQFLDDMSERKKNIAKKQESADTLRLKGNKHFKNKNFAVALELYMDALKHAPFDAKLLLNIAQAHIKLKAMDDAMEFLKRTLFLEPNNVKALSRQAFCLSEIGDSAAALVAINKALQLDPSNVELQAQQREVQVVETEKQAEKQLHLLSEVEDKQSIIALLGRLHEQLTTKIDFASIVSTLESILQQPEERFDNVAKAYFRTSNCLSTLLETSRSHFASETKNSTFLSLAMQVVNRGINFERSGKQMLLDLKFVPVLREMIADISETNLSVFVPAIEIITTLCKDDTCLKSRLTIFADKQIVSLVGNALGNLSNNLLQEVSSVEAKVRFEAVDRVLDLVKVFAATEPGRNALDESSSSVQIILVLSMGTALHVLLHYRSSSNFNQNTILVMVEILLGLSQIVSMRSVFSLGLPLDNENGKSAVVTVVGTIMRAISVFPDHAANLLAVLMNAAIEQAEDTTHAVRQAIIAAGGIELALSYDKPITDDDEDLALLRNRKAGLLSRLVALPTAQSALLVVNVVDNSCHSFVAFCQRIVQLAKMKSEGRLDESKFGNIARWQNDELAHLVRALATLPSVAVNHPKLREIALTSKLMPALLSLLPMPRMDCGEITPQSVTLVPYVIPPTLLVGNVARGLLLFADDIPCARGIFVEEKNIGVQRLICAMATCDDIRVRRNIAIVLAKGCRLQEGNVKEKVKHFRGLQMMIELQDKL